MFHFTFTAAQIRIGGNVYGGGNMGEVKGSTKVTVLAGEIGAVDSAFARPLVNPKGKVFGGSRMANIGGNTYVHIDGEHFTKDNSTTPDYILINQVFGGNDIAGTIGTAAAVGETVPDELTGIKRTAEDAENPKKNVVDNTFNSYVRVSTKATGGVPDSDAKKVYIGQLFAGGNGDYDYEQTAGPEAGQVTHSIYSTDKDHTLVAQVVTNTEDVGFQLPELDKTYLEVVGGSIVYAYGGGNNATVKEKTIIHIDNPSAVVNHIYVNAEGVENLAATEESHAGLTDLLSTTRFKEMGINTTFSQPSSGEYQVGRFFGGNNKAEMSIRPTWNLLAGKVRNLYSGGNSGNMTSPEGLLLEVPTYSTLEVENLYGGCRMADVVPTVNGEYTPCVNLPGYKFPNELSARTLVRGGHIINVYGGNDVTGTVYGGNALGIYTQVYGNVYGGGNGAYPYTDNDLMEDDDTYGDFYYGNRIQGSQTSYEALNAFRPNAEQVSIRLAGTDKDHPTIVHGSIFVGGNCASLATKKKKPMVELKIGSHVIADNVFLGNNGEGMINKDYLKLYNGDFSSMSLTDPDAFAGYMEGVAMTLQPSIVFDSEANGDPATYEPYSSYVGSFYCGGNVGSMAIKGKETFTIDQGLNIFSKFVGGCNNADVPELKDDETGTKLTAAYEGGLIGAKDERGSTETTFFTETGASDGKIKDRLEINMDNLTIVPLRWNDDNTKLIWNTHKWEEDDFVPIANEDVDDNTRLLGGNVYGGCYESGHVNGNVVININEDVVKRDEIFGTGKSGVNITNQSDDVLAVALTLFGAGYGKETEIWGSTTVNHNNGYVFQIFGGGELGVVGKKVNVLDEHGETDQVYEFNPAYSTTVNLSGSATATSNDGAVENLAEAIYVYGGGNEGDVCGNTLVNLGNGRIYDAFGGASDADILGHAEVYIGRQPNGSGGYKDGFPWVRDIVYGGNDFGGTIHGEYEDGYDFAARLRNYATDKTQLHGYQDGQIPDVLQSSTYVEYLTGRVDTIFGGGYGYYDYSNTKLYGEGIGMPKQHSAFVNIRPKNHGQNALKAAFGGGTGYPGNRDDDRAQDRSYVLVDIPDGVTNFSNMEVFGAGSYNGLGMGQDKDKLANGTIKLDEASAIVDLLRGSIHNAYGGSYNEGVTRCTVVNVPAQSSIQIDNIFGGAYGTRILPPCDVYETQVNYKNTSENAQVSGAIYGGNNNQRRSIFTQVNISSPVYSNKAKGYTGTVYGAGRGYNSWAEYTEVNLEKGARVYNVYGGAELGHVLNSASVQAYQNAYKGGASPDIIAEEPIWESATENWQKAWKDAWTLGTYYIPNDDWSNYATNSATNLDHVSARPELDNKTAAQLDGQKKHNTNVLIKEGAVVEGYAYGGGLGSSSISGSGDVYGTTYIAVLGGEVKKDVYAGGRTGAIDNLFGVSDFAGHKFVATANAYLQGGTARNVYGGGYEGNVGYHAGSILADYSGDRPALSYVVIGKKGTDTFVGGAPAITRNVYGGGEGGSLYGTSNVTLNNGYVGYRYDSTTKKYVEELNDQKPGDLDLSGNVFGGGYVINSFVDNTNIKMYGGTVRGSLFGGGEIGPIGRGSIRYTADGCLTNGDAHIRHAGMTNVTMYDGHVLRNVFGGGRGKDSWGGDGTMYMDPSVVATLDMKCKGFVFGQTRVNIHGGEIGTDEGMAHGYGNVFGGCDEGSVYSAYMDIAGTTKTLHVGNKQGNRYDGSKEGYYYKGTTSELTEDCKVVVEPHAQAYLPITINSHSYAAGDYVPTSDLNTLKNKTADAAYWDNLDPDGIIIHNAVFAGGNLAAGSSSLFANATTVYGNATASIHDVYNRDLITIGTGHTGGLYGDGNLTFVDGYRELNITNYGTDYYHITKWLSYDAYKDLPVREKAYYELKYKCLKECTDNEGTTYKIEATLPQDELLVLFAGNETILPDGKPNPAYWQENGVVTVYAGRIMNTIQRADFCGVFGSRMVMKGAPDRVPEKADYTNYTINRVREVSLNKKTSIAGDTDDNATHGNYFGIYSTVNYLGALTSDVKFSDVRTTNADLDNNPELKPGSETQTFYEWKSANIGNKKRNNGNCHNHLALASGVSLELTTEKSTGNTLTTKDWGPVTGVIELDLINVQPGVGGGFVYAKNIHGNPSTSGVTNTTLTELNTGAASKKDYTYNTNDDAEHQHQWETSGNFIHSSQTIIDDCYNVSNRYFGTNKMPAHYWYIAGSVYVYDQYISAYTGSPNAYSETVEIPITISASANGKMTLMDVQPNLYAYYSSANTPLAAGQKLVIGDVTYQKNSPISYWEWSKLPAATRALFVKDTYVNTKAYKTSAESEEIIAANSQVVLTQPGGELYSVAEEKMVPASEIFRSSNNLSHKTGYLLTYNVTNPKIWDKWYTKVTNTTTGKVESDQTGGTGYEDGPTYHPTTNGLYGQKMYDKQAIIPEKTYTDYEALASKPSSGQAAFTKAYLVTKEYSDATQHYYPGAPVSTAKDGFTSDAYVSTATIQLSPTEFIYVNDLMTEDQKNKYYNRFHKTGATPAEEAIAKDINELITPAYICTTAGLYGGSYYEKDKNYRALEAYSAMSPEDRKKFDFNYDALDLLIDSNYGGATGKKYQYDGMKYDHVVTDDDKDKMIYSLPKPIDYTATYNSTSSLSLPLEISVKRGDNTISTDELQQNDELFSTEFEKLPNEQHHYTAIAIKASNKDTVCYVVNTSFIHGDTPYAVGTTISGDTYNGLSDDKENITALTFKSDANDKTYYYCREEYQVDENGAGVKPTAVGTTGGIVKREGKDWVQVGTIINAISDGDKKGYNDLPNYQKNFTIHGVSPMETSTLYVARDADINDLSSEKIITVVYKYDYEESDKDGMHIVPVTERHVVNIHINFKSGVPMVENINPPTIVLPGTGITMRIPTVTPGAYEITGGGWELFETKTNAESHVNGVPYTPSADPLYWYQDGFYLAYYAKTYLGKTYSNYVPVSVANYHDLKRVMDDKQNHLHVDYDRTRLKRDSKIYINDYSGSSENGLDLLKNLYDWTLITSSTEGITTAGDSITNAGHKLKGHRLMNTVNGPKAGENLEFFLRTDIDHSGSSWTPIGTIGTGGQCFEGTLHGDGHTISGLDNSLFGKLCGNVYNLGVTGSFTGAGIAEEGDGYVENCWIGTSSTAPKTSKPVFGNPTKSGFKQIVNSYYMEEDDATNKYTNHTGSYGIPTRKNAYAFYNGEVAYDLNGFYLYKRYNDGVSTAAGVGYKYYTLDASGDILEPKTPQTGHYADNMSSALCSSGYNGIKYVEDRFADGDFRYAAGEIPEAEDERAYIDTEDENKVKFFPIWPDDYLFFGQKLTYGWAAQAHQPLPSAIAHDGGRLSDGNDANRVYRAPAYYRSKDMGVAHFNPDAYLAQEEALTEKQIEDGVTPRKAYPGMTAIDFHGHNDVYAADGANKAYELGFKAGKFYAPLLDDDGLTGIKNCDETRNLLVYAPAEAAVSGYANKKTYDVLNSTFTEPVYNSYYDGTNYRCVAQAPVASVQGHLVQNTLTATNDHLLVDMEDFNAPIAYHFDSDHLMWYQRTPANSEYVDRTKGWQGISVPFTAELVTTDRKGEITHFYSGSDNSQNGTKKGHEYWLREFTAVTEKDNVAKGTFLYPGADPSAANKTVTNSFLWDYYYKNETVHNQQDANADTYLQYRQYYKEPRSYTSYPMLAAAKPYILGLPGKTYYEFDLSGSFEAQNTAAHITKLGKQIITLASSKGIGIGISDGEMDGVTQTESGSKSYTVTFKPSYMNEELESGNYVMNAEGNAYEKLTASKKLGAFRPYFTATMTGAGSRRMAPERIVFDGDNGEEFEESPETVLDGSIEIFVRGRSIVARSHRKEAATIRIVNVAGIVLNDFVIESGQTVETPVKIPGVYMANKKKLFVK